MASHFHASAARHCVEREGGTSRHTFSFGAYHDPQRMGFGALRVLNEEWLAPGRSIPLHAHENMEVLTLALAGVLRHEDSRGARQVIAPGEIHLLSAGLGVTHREFNHSTEFPAHYLQAWIAPKATRTPTRYGHGVLSTAHISGRFVLAAGPAGSGSVVEIDQDAFVSLIQLEASACATYRHHARANGLYVFLIDGCARVDDALLAQGDALAVAPGPVPVFAAARTSTLLCIEVPLQDYQV